MYNNYDLTAINRVSEIDEWEVVGQWMWDNKEFYNGLSVLPFDGGSYSQAPFEDITEEQYNELVGQLTSIDLSLVTEDDDITDLAGEVACGADGCVIV
jgi:ribonucleoside-diphosphate reductase alpha chain